MLSPLTELSAEFRTADPEIPEKIVSFRKVRLVPMFRSGGVEDDFESVKTREHPLEEK